MKWLNGFSTVALAAAGVIGLGGILSGGAAQARTGLIVPEEVYRLCERRSFTRAEIRALQKRPDYALILRYTADQCGGVAAVLSEGTTATLPTASGAGGAVSRGTAALGGVAQCTPGLGLENSCDPICERRLFTTREIAKLKRSKEFPAILEYTLGNCPAVASVLTDSATATLPDDPDPRGENGNGGGGNGGGGGDTGGGGNGGGGNGGGGNDGGNGGGGDTGGGGNGGGGNGGGGNGGGGNGGGGNGGGGGDTGGGGNGGGGNGGGGGDTGGGGNGGGNGGGGDTGGGDTGGGGNGGGNGGGGDTGGGDTGGGNGGGGGGHRPPEPDRKTDPSGWQDWRDTYGPGSGWKGAK